jgi:hypothetical protein
MKIKYFGALQNLLPAPVEWSTAVGKSRIHQVVRNLQTRFIPAMIEISSLVPFTIWAALPWHRTEVGQLHK